MTVALSSNYRTWSEQRLDKFRLSQGKWAEARCPLHADKKPSLRIDLESGGCKCNSAGCSFGQGHIRKLAEAAGLSTEGLPGRPPAGGNGKAKLEQKAEYFYPLQDGTPFGLVRRYWDSDTADKTFRQLTWKDGEWSWGSEGKAFPIYRADKIAEATSTVVLWLEGEKCVDQAVKLGFEATTSAGGAQRFGKCDGSSLNLLKGKRVFVIPDNDLPGRAYAEEVARGLQELSIDVKVVELPGLELKGDLVNWVSAGGTAASLKAIIEGSTPEESIQPPPEWPEICPLDAKPPVAAFPIHTLPAGTLREFALATARELQVPVDMCAWRTFGALATAVVGALQVQLGGGWVEPCNLFPWTVAPPAERKSPCHKAYFKPVEDFEQAMIRKSKEENRRRKATREVLGTQIKEARKDGAEVEKLVDLQEQIDRNSPLPEPRFLLDDATPEALTSAMAENRGRAVVSSAEGTILSNMARYSRDGSANADTMLKAYSGDPIRMDRVNKDRPSERIYSSAMVVDLAFQPSVLEALGSQKGLVGQGLPARVEWCYPDSGVGHREVSPPWVSDRLKEEYNSLLSRLLSTYQGLEKPKVIFLTLEALNRFREFQAWVEPQLDRDNGELGFIGDWAGKLCGRVSRWASLIHVGKHAHVEPDDLPGISGETMAEAIEIGKYSISHAVRCYAVMGIHKYSNNLGTARIILKRLQDLKKDRLQVRELHRMLDGSDRFKARASLDAPLKLLEERGYIRIVAEAQGGRPTQVIELNPDLRLEAQAQEQEPERPAPTFYPPAPSQPCPTCGKPMEPGRRYSCEACQAAIQGVI